MPMRSIHNSFTKGQLDPTLYARVDSDIYTKGARELTNMFSLWTGAVRIAPGTVYIDMMVDRENSNAVITDTSYVKAFDFLYDADGDVIYTVVLRQSNSTSSAIDIYFENTLKATVTTTGYTADEISDVTFAPSHERVLLLHQEHQPGKLVRGASHTSWTFTTYSFDVLPSFDFSVIGEAPSYRSITFTLSSAAIGSGVTCTASAAIFNSGHAGGWLIGNGGVAFITAVASTTSITVSNVETFSSTTVSGSDASLREVMWGDHTTVSPAGSDRKYPTKAVFFLDRLVIGRTPVIKNVAAFSTSGVYDDFNEFLYTVDASTAFTLSFNGRGEQAIQSIVADDSLVFLTSNKIFASSPLVETPLTALNAYFPPQTQAPSANIEAVTIDNQTMFIGYNRTEIVRAIYNTQVAKYVGSPASILSTNLITGANSHATWEPESVSSKLYMCTNDDGTMAMYSTLLEQEISAWSKRTTRGNYLQVIGESRQSHVLVQRQINLGTSTFETLMDYAYLSDSTFSAFYDVQSILAAATTTVTVLENQYDYIILGNDVPFTAIDITLDTVSSDDCGLTFEYLDGNDYWVTFTPTDNTTGFTSSNSITWAFTDVGNWMPNTLNAVKNKFWMRIRRTTETVSTVPIMEQIDVNTGNRIFLEKQDFDYYMDSSVNTSSNSSGDVTGLTNLAGHQVYARADGATYGPFFVDSSGATNITNEYSTVDIGIAYTPRLIPMPLFTPTQEGMNTYTEKYIQDLYIDYVDSLYLKAGIGEVVTDIPNMQLSNYTLGQSVPPQTGFYTINPRGGWDPRQEIIITQSQPGPMTIIGIGYNVEVT